MTAAERSAQLLVQGIIQTSLIIKPGDSLEIWREYGAVEWKASAERISNALDVLGVSHTSLVSAGRRRAPWQKKVAPQRWYKIIITWQDLPDLTRWLPFLEKRITAIAQEDPRE